MPGSCVAAVVAFWMGLAPWYQDRDMSTSARTALLTPVAEAMCAATSVPGELAFLASQPYHETHLAAYVIQGRCSEGPAGARCDEGRAWGVLQVHPWCSAAHDESLPVRDRRIAAAKCALRGWRRGNTQWGGPAGGFQSQRNGGPPQPWAHARVKLWRLALAAVTGKR